VPEIWNKSQRAVLAAFILLTCIFLAIRHRQRPQFIPDPPSSAGPRASELVTTLNPNTASLEQLAILPNLGEDRAKKIISHRTQYAHDHPGEPAFKKLDDLLQVQGIGVAMLETLEPYLLFDLHPASTTRP